MALFYLDTSLKLHFPSSPPFFWSSSLGTLLQKPQTTLVRGMEGDGGGGLSSGGRRHLVPFLW